MYEGHCIVLDMFRPIRLDHTNCLQVAIKTHSFIPVQVCGAKINFFSLLQSPKLLYELTHL
jgi:hypothetical protein